MSLLKFKQNPINTDAEHKILVNKTYIAFYKVLLETLKLKDLYTYGHCLRVSKYSLSLGIELGLSRKELFLLELSALFHDIGKIGIPDNILKKPDKLTDEEYNIMKKHPGLSGDVLKKFPGFEKIHFYAKCHHERYDGKGYPSGLKENEIPLFSRIILIADTYDAMTSTRPYRKGLSQQIAFTELKKCSGTQFDSKLVDYFINGFNNRVNNDSNSTLLIKEILKKAA